MEDNKANRLRFRAWMDEAKYITAPFTLFDKPSNILESDYIMQSTGLVDKNGKEIFEGDLLEYDGEIIEIKPPEWQVIDAFCVHCRPGLDSFRDDYSRENEPSRMIRKGEIIGNIYENGELLK